MLVIQGEVRVYTGDLADYEASAALGEVNLQHPV
jgi:hypothetical protein